MLLVMLFNLSPLEQKELGSGAQFTVGVTTAFNGLLLNKCSKVNSAQNALDYLEYNSTAGTRLSN